jgi:aryl-alcohol dehydrogenase-like predicted oxidoreductase
VRTLRLGHSELTVSALCLGTMFFGTTVAEDRANAILDRYLERGGNFVDTANNYASWIDGGTGNESESLLGHWLARTDASVVLATKLGARPRPGTSGAAQGLSAAAVRQQLDGSLQRLQRRSVDLLYLHIDDPSVPVRETQAVLADLLREGTIRAYGASNMTRDRLAERDQVNLELTGRPNDAIQMRYSFLTPVPGWSFGRQVSLNEEITEYAAGRGTTIAVYSALLNGSYVRADRAVPEGYRHGGTESQLAALRTVANRRGATANQVVLAWLLALEPPLLPVLGVSSIEQLDEAVDAEQLHLDADDLEELTAARSGSRCAPRSRPGAGRAQCR